MHGETRTLNSMLTSVRKKCFEILPERILYLFIGKLDRFRFEIERCGKNLYLLQDNDLEMFVCRPRRLFKYRDGLGHRLEQIFNKYLIANIKLSDGDLVVDVGANIGEFALALRWKFDSAKIKVVAIEPDPIELHALQRNLELGDIVLTHFLSDSQKPSKVVFSNESGDTRILLDKEESLFPKSHSIETSTLDHVISKLGIDHIRLLKLEVEGLEPEVLIGGTKTLNLCDYVTIDVSPERLGNDTFDEVNEIMMNNGFNLKESVGRAAVLFARVTN